MKMADKDTFDIMNFLPYLLNQAAEQTSLEFQAYYKARYGMLRGEWRVLFHLGKHRKMTASDISSAAKMHKTKISRAVKALSDKRYVMRDEDCDDRRKEHLALTLAGQRVYDELREMASSYNQQLMAEFSPAEATQLKLMLSKLAALKAT